MKISRETYILEMNEWLIIIGKHKIPLYPIFLTVVIMVLGFCGMALFTLVNQNNYVMLSEYNLKNPECSFYYDMGRIIPNCTDNVENIDKWTFEMPNKGSIIND
jgi:hypothetical protein